MSKTQPEVIISLVQSQVTDKPYEKSPLDTQHKILLFGKTTRFYELHRNLQFVKNSVKKINQILIQSQVW